jgi:plasmid stabilization system protein ParE
MASPKIEFHEEVASEFEAAFEWYFVRNGLAAARFVSELNRALELIPDVPDRWPTGGAGTHRFLLRRFPFAIVYRQRPPVIQVLAIAHGHRRPGYWKERS